MNAERSIALLRGDITQIAVDAIVNAANSSLLGGGGVDGAIHRAGGPIILEQCRAINGCATGNAVITDAGRLPAGYVIHAVGPVWRGGREGEAGLLASAYRQALRLAEHHTLTSLAFPSISTGAYGYPIVEASRIALETTIAHMRGDGSLRRVIFVLFSDSDLVVYRAALAALLPDTAAARPQDPAGGQA